MTCNVCGKPISPGDGYVEGVDCFVCAKCVEHLGKMWAKSVGIEVWEQQDTAVSQKPLMKPKEIKEFLDNYIIGQGIVKERVATAVYNHYKRLQHDTTTTEISKSNILIIGPTGTGKTMIARAIAKLVDVPFVVCDATSLTEAGYVGDDVESLLVKLYHAAGKDVARTERGIVFIDEIDKISRKGGSASITRDVSGEGVQQALLKIVEGDVIGIPPDGGRKHPEQELVYINTKNILFICSGAFEGVTTEKQKPIGFTAQAAALKRKDISPDDLKDYGLIPEFIGRFPVITQTKALTEQQVLRIMTEPKDAIVKQYKALLEMDGVTLIFTNGALKEIAAQAMKQHTGARGLRLVMEEVMGKIMFEAPSSDIKEVVVDSNAVKNALS